MQLDQQVHMQIGHGPAGPDQSGHRASGRLNPGMIPAPVRRTRDVSGHFILG